MIGRHLIFPTCHTFDAILGHISVFDRDLQIPTGLCDRPQLRDSVGLMIRSHFVMTLRKTFPWFVSSGSHFPMSLWFLDGVILDSWTLTSSFRWSTCQIYDASPLSCSWVIRTDQIHLMSYWGIFPSFSYGDGRSVTDLLQFSSFDREISYLLHGSLFWRYSSRWAFSVAWRSDRDSYLSRSLSWDSLVDHSIWSSRLINRAFFETHGVSFKPFWWIESYGDMLHWGIFPPIILSPFGIQSLRAFLVTTFIVALLSLTFMVIQF